MKIDKPKSKQPIPINARKVFKGIIFDVYQWEQELYDGTSTTFEKLKRPDTVLIVPVTTDGKIILGIQEQPGKATTLDFIAGRADGEESTLDAAKRELSEETGHEAKNWLLLDTFQPFSKIDWAIYILIAKGCQKISEQKLDGGEKIDLKFVDFEQFSEMVQNGKLGNTELRVKFLEAKLDPNKMVMLKKLIME